MIEQHQSLGVYFIDQYNFPNLCDSAQRGDALAADLIEALLNFINGAPHPVCAMCERHVPQLQIPRMVIIIMHADNATLTTWVCEECSTRDDLDDQIKKTVREWPIIPEEAIIEICNKKTLH